MQHTPVNLISVLPHRLRKDFDPSKLMELTESIRKNGLMHPLVVRHENGNILLVAGERRLRAIQDLWDLGESLRFDNQHVTAGTVPTITLGELDELSALECELEENVRRADLTWQENAQALQRLHELRLRVHPGHTVGDTAREVYGVDADTPLEKLGSQYANVKETIAVAAHLDDPDVSSAKSSREAFKILVRKEEAASNAALADKVGLTFGAHSHNLLLADSTEWMLGTCPPAQFDVILTDPPYGMDAQDFGDAAGRLVGIDHQYKDDWRGFKDLLTEAARGFDRVAKVEAHLYVCCDIDQFHFLKQLFTSIGDWNVFRTPLINYKTDAGRVPLPEHGPRRCYETILYAFRGRKRVTAIFPDVIETRGDDNLGHGAQKPVSLFRDLLRRSCRPGDRALDPFCGTGTIFPASHELRVAATGIEREPAYYGIAVKRIESLK